MSQLIRVFSLAVIITGISFSSSFAFDNQNGQQGQQGQNQNGQQGQQGQNQNGLIGNQKQKLNGPVINLLRKQNRKN